MMLNAVDLHELKKKQNKSENNERSSIAIIMEVGSWIEVYMDDLFSYLLHHIVSRGH